MKVILTKFDKHDIADLPKAKFPGRIITINTPGETEKAVDYLLSHNILGVDTETRPTFNKREQNQVCLLQVSTKDTCFLFRLHLTGMTPAIIRLLEDTQVPKIGLSWHDDLHQLHRRAEFTPGYFVELQDMAIEVGIKDKSLQKIYANLFHEKISKTQRLSNWEADVLRDSQKLYAATDAWTCIRIYEEILRLKAMHDYELVVVPEPEPTNKKKKEEPTDGAEPTGEEAKPQPKKRKKPQTATTTAQKEEAEANSSVAEASQTGEGASQQMGESKGSKLAKKLDILLQDPNLPKRFIRYYKRKRYLKRKKQEENTAATAVTVTPKPLEPLPDTAKAQLSRMKEELVGGKEMADFME